MSHEQQPSPSPLETAERLVEEIRARENVLQEAHESILRKKERLEKQGTQIQNLKSEIERLQARSVSLDADRDLKEKFLRLRQFYKTVYQRNTVLVAENAHWKSKQDDRGDKLKNGHRASSSVDKDVADLRYRVAFLEETNKSLQDLVRAFDESVTSASPHKESSDSRMIISPSGRQQHRASSSSSSMLDSSYRLPSPMSLNCFSLDTHPTSPASEGSVTSSDDSEHVEELLRREIRSTDKRKKEAAQLAASTSSRKRKVRRQEYVIARPLSPPPISSSSEEEEEEEEEEEQKQEEVHNGKEEETSEDESDKRFRKAEEEEEEEDDKGEEENGQEKDYRTVSLADDVFWKPFFCEGEDQEEICYYVVKRGKRNSYQWWSHDELNLLSPVPERTKNDIPLSVAELSLPVEGNRLLSARYYLSKKYVYYVVYLSPALPFSFYLALLLSLPLSLSSLPLTLTPSNSLSLPCYTSPHSPSLQPM